MKTREVEDGKKLLVRKLWIADGSSVDESVVDSKQGTLCEKSDGTLGPDCLPAYDPDDPEDRVKIDARLRELDAAARSNGHLRTVEQMWYDIRGNISQGGDAYLALRSPASTCTCRRKPARLRLRPGHARLHRAQDPTQDVQPQGRKD